MPVDPHVTRRCDGIAETVTRGDLRRAHDTLPQVGGGVHELFWHASNVDTRAPEASTDATAILVAGHASVDDTHLLAVGSGTFARC